MDEVLHLLAEGGFVTGEEMSRVLGISRMAVHKRIESLRAQGIAIEARPKRGYRLEAPENVIAAPLLQRGLSTRWAGCVMRTLPRVDSTNQEAKALAAQGAPHGQLVVAESQGAGRGRRGRDWVSPPGVGLWSTLLLRPGTPPAGAPGMTMLCALAVCDAVQTLYRLDAEIKWPNDVILGGRKLTGILVELSADIDQIHWAVAGVGINVNQALEDFPEDLRDRATSIALALGHPVPRGPLLRAYLAAFETRYETWHEHGFGPLMPDYQALSRTLGQRVRVEAAAETYEGQALRIDDLGALYVMRDDGTQARVLAGDVSVRGVMGYV